jgi:hypothetical protein
MTRRRVAVRVIQITRRKITTITRRTNDKAANPPIRPSREITRKKDDGER